MYYHNQKPVQKKLIEAKTSPLHLHLFLTQPSMEYFNLYERSAQIQPY